MAKLSPIGNNAQFINGIPANGAKLFTYVAGSSTKLTTYTDEAGLTAQANPIILDSRGEPAQPIWLTEGLSYKFVFAPSTDSDPPVSPIWDIDNVTGINDSSVSLDQWVDPGVTPTYVNATQFTLPGDQTSAFQVNRRIKATVTAGTVYGYISGSAYTSLTTVTVVLDSGTLDSGLSAVQLGLITPTNTSIRVVTNSIADLAVTNAKLAEQYINDLTTVTLDPSADYLAIADASDSGNKKKALIKFSTVETSQATTSGTSKDFTSIPAWVTQITIGYVGVSTNGTSNLLVRIGDTDGIDNTGYLGSGWSASGAAGANDTSGFLVTGGNAAATIIHGASVLTLVDSATNTWVWSNVVGQSNAANVQTAAGSKSLSAVLDRLTITTVNGTDAFDAGKIGVSYR